jgi:hypothetical protein
MPPPHAIHPFQAAYNLPAVTVIADAGILSEADLTAMRTPGSGSSSDEDGRVISM